MTRINTLLVASRGEIAVRIIGTAREMGLRTVAIYSAPDADAQHVRMADLAVLIGPAPAAQSYLDAARIIAAARDSGAEAIHPGYGFLSENADFARACAEAGLIFVGPSSDAIAAMGNKAEAKRLMQAAGVPCVPGYHGTAQDTATLQEAADAIGYPVMVKAAAGGGGRGMRLVQARADLPAALDAARAEAQSAFGSGELILEKAVQGPRHVEIQVLADSHGNILHLGERDCSVQRRHQKVIEEAPCPVMTPDLRDAMGAAAVAAARSIGYVGAGTVEFLLDSDGQYYFLEMNTRLQVEHPVTEMITGRDLVREQLQVAQGDRLSFSQADVIFDGHAIEVRLYAEDPKRDFLPATGRISRWRPAGGEGLRIDAGIAEGQDVSPHYDPMIAKVIAHGPDRDTARRRLIAGLKETRLMGLPTNRGFLIDTLAHPVFAEGQATTAFLGDVLAESAESATVPGKQVHACAAVALFLAARDRAVDRSLGTARELLGFSNAAAPELSYVFATDSDPVHVTLTARGAFGLEVAFEDQQNGDAQPVEILSNGDEQAKVRFDGRLWTLRWTPQKDGSLWLDLDGHGRAVRNLLDAPPKSDGGSGSGRVVAPMHALVHAVLVAPGDMVEVGQPLGVIEAMKMQHSVRADIAGQIASVGAQVGEQVSSGDVLFEISAISGKE